MNPVFSKMAVWTLGVGLVVVPACGHGDMDMMSNHSTMFDQHAAGYQAEIDAHRAAIGAASDLPRVATLETDHMSAVEPHMTAMRHQLDAMMGCTGPAGEQPSAGEVLGALDRLVLEDAGHRTAMAGAADIAGARAEEARHQGQMLDMMAEMRMHAAAMMDGRGHFSCHQMQ